MSAKFRISRLLLLFALLFLAAAPQAFACEGQIYIRVWQDGEDYWYEYGEEVDFVPGDQAHIYIHVQGRGENTYTTSARIGYPEEFGYDGDARTVERSVKMQAQNNDDRNSGRIRFRADQPNLVYLGFQITGVASPGSLNNVPNNCRTGYIPIRVSNE